MGDTDPGKEAGWGHCWILGNILETRSFADTTGLS